MATAGETYWQEKCLNVRQRMSRLYKVGKWRDCEFRVGAEGAPVRAHRLVLAAASPVLEGMLYGPMAHTDNDSPIHIPDMHAQAFNAMLRYMYTDDITIASCKVACELYYGGDKYMMPKLKSESLRYLKKSLSPDNAAYIYEFAKLFDEKQLAEKCLEMIKDQTLEVLISDSFTELQVDTVTKIYSLEPLNINTELELYDAAVRYATFSVNERENFKSLTKEESEGEPDIGKETEDKNCAVSAGAEGDVQDRIGDNDYRTKCDPPELVIRKAVKQIRFLAMDPQEFADHDFSLILSQSEICAIILNLTSETTHTPMPSGFSTNRESRIQVNKRGPFQDFIFRGATLYVQGYKHLLKKQRP